MDAKWVKDNRHHQNNFTGNSSYLSTTPQFMDGVPPPIPSKPTRLLDQIRLFLRKTGKSYATEKTYCYCIRFLIRYCRYKS